MSERRKNISTSFTVFLNTFLIISTVIIFAVLLFLSLRNMIDTKIDDTMGEAADICTYVSADIGDYIAHSESADDAIDGINRYLSSSVLTSKGQIWIIDGDTDVLFTNRNSDPESFALDDSAVDLVISGRAYGISFGSQIGICKYDPAAGTCFDARCYRCIYRVYGTYDETCKGDLQSYLRRI